MRKRILVLQVTDDMPDEELEHLQAIASMLGMTTESKTVNKVTDLEQCLGRKRRFDYVYLCAHANVAAFGHHGPDLSVEWEKFGDALCRSRCLKPGAILLLACCRSGIWQIASKLFRACDEIEYICGPRWELTPQDMASGFHVFLYNIEARREQPSTAATRASKATGFDFFFYDRLEVESRLQQQDVAANIAELIAVMRQATTVSEVGER